MTVTWTTSRSISLLLAHAHEVVQRSPGEIPDGQCAHTMEVLLLLSTSGSRRKRMSGLLMFCSKPQAGTATGLLSRLIWTSVQYVKQV